MYFSVAFPLAFLDKYIIMKPINYDYNISILLELHYLSSN